jgi:glycosyltransferase involved in cell wall biosynthesis
VTRRIVILTEIIAPYRIPVFNALAKLEGIDLHVIFLAETDPEAREWLVYKNEIRFSYQVLPSYRRSWGSHKILLNWGVRAALRKAASEVVVCGGYNYVASWQALSWARRNGVPFLLWAESNANDMRPNKRLVEKLKASFIGRCDGFVAPGRASLQYLMSLNVSRERIFIAPNAVDIRLFGDSASDVRSRASDLRQQLGLPRRFFIFVGRLVAEKGVFDLLHAYRQTSPEIRLEIGLVFLGDGPARSELERIASDIRPGLIQFRGFVQREMLARYYALSDALILPTHSDPWGLVVNEGMACGLPVVCTDVAGCVIDLVEEGWNGRVIPARDVRQLALTLEELTRNPETIRTMGENSRKRILDYSPEACAKGMAAAAAFV